MVQTEQREIHGLPVRIVNTRPDIQMEQVAQRLTAALDLVATYAPRCYRRLHSDLAGFVVERVAPSSRRLRGGRMLNFGGAGAPALVMAALGGPSPDSRPTAKTTKEALDPYVTSICS
jgi:hypothetical protein